MAFKADLSKVLVASDAADQKVAGHGRKSSVKWFKFEGSSINVRIMPPWTDKEPFNGQFWRIVGQHWKVSDEQRGPILCPKTTPGLDGHCPICDFVDELRKDKDNPVAQELVKDIKSKQAYMFTVVDCKDKSYTANDVADFKKAHPDEDLPFEVGDAKLQVYAAPFTVYNALISTFKNGGDFVDLENGHDVTISRQGSGLKTKYTVTPNFKPSKSNVPEEHPLVALESVGVVHTAEKLKELLSSGIGGEYLQLAEKNAKKGKAKALPKAAAKEEKEVEVEDDDGEPELGDGIGDGDDEDNLDDLEGRMGAD